MADDKPSSKLPPVEQRSFDEQLSYYFFDVMRAKHLAIETGNAHANRIAQRRGDPDSAELMLPVGFDAEAKNLLAHVNAYLSDPSNRCLDKEMTQSRFEKLLHPQQEHSRATEEEAHALAYGLKKYAAITGEQATAFVASIAIEPTIQVIEPKQDSARDRARHTQMLLGMGLKPPTIKVFNSEQASDNPPKSDGPGGNPKPPGPSYHSL